MLKWLGLICKVIFHTVLDLVAPVKELRLNKELRRG